jgi:hypothetical protein
MRSMGLERALGAQQGVVDWMLKKGAAEGGRLRSSGGGVGAGRGGGAAARGASPTPLLPNLGRSPKR